MNFCLEDEGNQPFRPAHVLQVFFAKLSTKALSDSSFTAYIIKVPVLAFLALSFQSIQLPLLLKFAIVSPIGVSLCFLFAYLVRKIPKVDRVL